MNDISHLMATLGADIAYRPFHEPESLEGRTDAPRHAAHPGSSRPPGRPKEIVASAPSAGRLRADLLSPASPDPAEPRSFTLGRYAGAQQPDPNSPVLADIFRRLRAR